MSEDSQERTEEATPKRKQELKQKGQVVRSKELNTMLNLMGAGIALLVFGHVLCDSMVELMTKLYTLERTAFFDKQAMIRVVEFAGEVSIKGMLPVLIISFIAILIGPSMLGGWSFSGDQIKPKLERLDFIKGIKKMFSIKGFVELIKSILKVILVVGVSAFLLWLFFDNFMLLIKKSPFEAMADSVSWVLYMFLAVSSSLVLVTLIDVPFQIFDHAKQSKMTKQQVKDEHKETEGRPEVKSKIQRMQREMARRRMMDEVAQADVVITNPTHYAVALKYDESMRAPKLVAKGLDIMAERIKEKASEANVPIVSLPPLARAVYFSTELDEEVPHGLYKAVAKVLAYIYQLRQYQRGKMKKPVEPKEVEIPEEYQR